MSSIERKGERIRTNIFGKGRRVRRALVASLLLHINLSSVFSVGRMKLTRLKKERERERSVTITFRSNNSFLFIFTLYLFLSYFILIKSFSPLTLIIFARFIVKNSLLPLILFIFSLPLSSSILSVLLSFQILLIIIITNTLSFHPEFLLSNMKLVFFHHQHPLMLPISLSLLPILVQVHCVNGRRTNDPLLLSLFDSLHFIQLFDSLVAFLSLSNLNDSIHRPSLRF